MLVLVVIMPQIHKTGKNNKEKIVLNNHEIIPKINVNNKTNRVSINSTITPNNSTINQNINNGIINNINASPILANFSFQINFVNGK